MENLRNVTLVFLVKKDKETITDICLAMKKRGFGANRWNGVGGKLKEEESIIEAAKRETKEEIDVELNDMKKVAELSFYFPHNPTWDQMAHVYFVDNWNGEPKESEEMRPAWFNANELPYKEMWPDDIYWIPEVLKGNLLKASFEFGQNDTVNKKEVNIVERI
ncbi:MAG: 8-oxo-dGTP diphosphatase [Candidatus Nealsonbacteria bacterium]|nr:8-oxo-dGTP diphosphatase [Candidatus Nealsonbacteria bacterium]